MTMFVLSSRLFALGVLTSSHHTKPRQTEQNHKQLRAFAICHILLLVDNCDYTDIIIILFKSLSLLSHFQNVPIFRIMAISPFGDIFIANSAGQILRFHLMSH